MSPSTRGLMKFWENHIWVGLRLSVSSLRTHLVETLDNCRSQLIAVKAWVSEVRHQHDVSKFERQSFLRILSTGFTVAWGANEHLLIFAMPGLEVLVDFLETSWTTRHRAETASCQMDLSKKAGHLQGLSSLLQWTFGWLLVDCFILLV